jgi:predicted nucleotidyltransferase
MQDKIQHYLEQLEQEKEITILLACETGSRAWGFPSPDSDYDIRILYCHTKDWYLSLNDKKDSIDVMYENNDIDITGWDLRKSLKLLAKSNAALLERIQSPIVYKSQAEFVEQLVPIAQNHYSKISTIHHYLSMAKRFVDEVNEGPDYKLKTFFYGLRSAMACKWILEKDEMPPIKFKKMYMNLNLDKKIVTRINELILLKATISESYKHSGEEDLRAFMGGVIKESDDKRKGLPSAKGNMDDLNSLFINMITQYDH